VWRIGNSAFARLTTTWFRSTLDRNTVQEDGMKRFLLGAAVLFVSLTSASAQFTFTSIDYPGGTQTRTRGINNHGEIVGGYRVVPPGHALLVSGPILAFGPKLRSGYEFQRRIQDQRSQ
jgi:hypothetical protein